MIFLLIEGSWVVFQINLELQYLAKVILLIVVAGH